MDPLFLEIGIAVSVAAALAGLVRLLHQPPLLAYVLTGVILGPLGTHFLHSQAAFESLKQIGVALSLFLIGLELDWGKAREVIRSTSLIGIIQILGSACIGGFTSLLLGFSPLTSLYAGLALGFSSTVVVVKLLSENRELSALHGRLAVGLLLFQDIIAIVVLIIIGGVSAPNALPLPIALALLSIKLASVLVILYIASHYMLPALFARVARSQELLFLFSLAWCFLLALGLGYLDFPLAIGAFLAGVSLAALPYTLEILTRLRSLRDFFVIILFVSLGSTLILPSTNTIPLTIALLGLTLVAKPALVLFGLLSQGYRSRTAFFAALTQGQMSEFSLILIQVGKQYGQLSSSVASSILFATVTSIALSTLVLANREYLYPFIRPFIRPLERHQRHHPHAQATSEQLHGHVVIFGYHRMGYHILKRLQDLEHRALVVDFNPDIIKQLKQQQVDCLYGDLQDEDMLQLVQAKAAAMLICTVPHREETMFLIEQMNTLKSEAVVVVTANRIDDALEYYKQGADYVILPHLLGGERIAELVGKYKDGTLRTYIRSQSEEAHLLKAHKHRLYYE